MRRRAQEWSAPARATVGALLALGLVAVLGVSPPAAATAQPGPVPVNAVVPSCDPRILVSRAAGLVDASGTGVGSSAHIVYTDTSGAPLADGAGTVVWSFRAIISAPSGMPRVSHDIGGYLNLDVTTVAGHQFSFRAHCIAGAGTFALPSPPFSEGGVVLYANGITTGWPDGPSSARQGRGARRTFVHFEAFRLPSGQYRAYVALIDGEDCALNVAVELVTRPPDLVRGTGTSTGVVNRDSYTETDCSLLGGPGASPRRGPLIPSRPGIGESTGAGEGSEARSSRQEGARPRTHVCTGADHDPMELVAEEYPWGR